ncbi:haloalkane dehalogenase [Kitasatospora sp. NPDC086009]|uniref:haloalkane dehalogenase n=1 Tax=unclassified Kitasatospora TaxID=2633591 RepID=UPI0037C97BD4
MQQTNHAAPREDRPTMPTVDVIDSHIAYTDSAPAGGTDSGPGHPPVVFLHGNPTSSHLWRGVTPHVAGRARTLAPDLIGMGASGKPDIAYDFADQARYLDAWFDALDLRDVVLVGHDWGGALALDRAARHPERVRGVVLLETMLKPLTAAELPAPARARFEAFRTPGVGERLVLEQNVLIETAFTGGVLTPLAEPDVRPYRAPYPTPASRRPLLAWPRMMPIDGEPADVVARMTAYGIWLANSTDVPKLLLTFDSSPTLLIDEAMVAWSREHISHLTVEHCGPAGHHAPEDRPDAIGGAIADWLAAQAW